MTALPTAADRVFAERIVSHHAWCRALRPTPDGCDCGAVQLRDSIAVDRAAQRQAGIQQEPACRWAHGPVTELDSRGLCRVCAEDDE